MAAVHRLLPVLGLAVLSACAGTQTPQPPRGGPELVLGSEGLDVGTTGLEIGFGRAPEGHGVVIIGDTPADVTCGQGIGARAVAVATGSYRVEELEAAGAHATFATFDDTDRVLEAILS